MRPDPTPAKASKAAASRFYQLRTGHALIGPYLKKIGKRASDACWWCDRGVSSLASICKKWKSQQAIPVGRGPAEVQEVEDECIPNCHGRARPDTE